MLSFELLGGDAGVYGPTWGARGRVTFANDFDRLYQLTEGEAEVRPVEGTAIRVLPGRLYLFPGGAVRRTYRCRGEMGLRWVHFRAEVMPGFGVFSRWRPPVCVDAGADASRLMGELVAASRSALPGETLDGVGGLCRLLRPFFPESWDALFPRRQGLARLEPALSAIRENLDRTLTLGELAQRVHLHPSYFSRLFRETLGRPPLQYHLELRMRRACALLLEGAGGVADAAYACGYDDPLYFSKVFRRMWGVSPREYCRRQGRLEP